MASIIALGNVKGGVGKSTLAVNLACALARQGPAVLADADEQATSVAWARAGRLLVRVHPLPLGTGAAALKSWITAALRLRPEGKGMLVIDLPPHLGSATTAALTVADLLVVPVPASGMARRRQAGLPVGALPDRCPNFCQLGNRGCLSEHGRAGRASCQPAGGACRCLLGRRMDRRLCARQPGSQRNRGGRRLRHGEDQMKRARTGIGASLDADTAAAQASALMQQRQVPQKADTEPYGTTSVHMPVALLEALRDAANRRASKQARLHPKGRGGRPSVSEIVVELLQRRADELRTLD